MFHVPVNKNANSQAAPGAGNRLLLAAIILTALNLRTAVTGFSVLTEAAGKELVFGPVVAGAIGTVVTACFAAAAFLAPRFSRRFGLERTAALALVITTSGIALRALAWSPWVVIAGSVVAFAGVGTSNVILIPIVKEHFPDRIKQVALLYMVMLQVGQLAAPLVAVPLADAAGWRSAAGVWAAMTVPAAALWFAVVRRPTRSVSVVPPIDPANSTVSPFPLRRSPFVWGLTGLMAMTTLHTYTLVTWFPTMLKDAGLSTANSAVLLSWFAGLGLVGAFAVPALMGTLRGPFPIVVSCAALMATGYIGMMVAPAAGAIVWATAFGLGVSTFPLCLTLIGERAKDTQTAGQLSSIVQGIGYGAGCLGPIALGLLKDSTNSWHWAYIVLMTSLVVTLTAGWAASRPVRAWTDRTTPVKNPGKVGA